ncbi:glutamate receptor ionotropic, kainate 1-like, partial [Centruroides sculpturatus]|uniref:glutamate receptor ionotropic, kainate 1-like n=1 Tax=Centruroides sculpturatus TaxID=218467 RepID=UPI000C6CEF32
CMQVSSGVSAIFGPQDPLLGSHIQSLCDALDIPHVECRLDMEPEIKEFSINLHPSPRILGNSIRDLIRYLNWTKVAVIYEEDMSLISLQELLRPPLPRELQVIFRKSNKEMFRQVLRDIKSRGIYSVIVDTKPDSLPVLLQARISSIQSKAKWKIRTVLPLKAREQIETCKYWDHRSARFHI